MAIGNGLSPCIGSSSDETWFRARRVALQTALAGARYNRVDVKTPTDGAQDSAILRIVPLRRGGDSGSGRTNVIPSCVGVFLAEWVARLPLPLGWVPKPPPPQSRYLPRFWLWKTPGWCCAPRGVFGVTTAASPWGANANGNASTPPLSFAMKRRIERRVTQHPTDEKEAVGFDRLWFICAIPKDSFRLDEMR